MQRPFRDSPGFWFFNRLSLGRASLAIEGRILFKVNPEQALTFRRGRRRDDLKSKSEGMACFIYPVYLV